VAGRGNVYSRRRRSGPTWASRAFLLELPFGRHQLDLGFRSEILRYVELTNQDTEHYVVLGNLLLHFPGGLKFNLKEDFTLVGRRWRRRRGARPDFLKTITPNDLGGRD
jgi:hypothetical protein